MASSKPHVAVQPITDRDSLRVGEFLHANMNPQVPVDAWVRAVKVAWEVDRPNAGFMLVDGGAIVGAYLACYSERVINDVPVRFCNLADWCVLPEYRFHALRLLKALLAQDGYHFTDLTPSEPSGDGRNVIGINLRLGFRFLDTTTTVVPNLPWPLTARRGKISSDPALLERTLHGEQLRLYHDHAASAAARHLVLLRDGDWCYVMFRKERHRGLPVLASILYVSNPELFRAMTGPLTRHLLLRHRAAVTMIERAVVEHRPRLSRAIKSPHRRRMFLSSSLDPAQIDYLYSELVWPTHPREADR
jgi:hypothetical protein